MDRESDSFVQLSLLIYNKGNLFPFGELKGTCHKIDDLYFSNASKILVPIYTVQSDILDPVKSQRAISYLATNAYVESLKE